MQLRPTMNVLLALLGVASALHPVEHAALGTDLVLQQSASVPGWALPATAILLVLLAIVGYVYVGRATAPMADVEVGSKLSAEGLMEAAKEKFGSKLSEGEVAQIIQEKAQGFGDRFKNLLMNELNSAASAVGKALEADDYAAILEWDSNISANFPSMSVLLAGLLVPVNLSINYACHASQVFLVLLPIALMTLVSEYMDREHLCGSIPYLRLWARLTLATSLLVMCCRLLMMKRISTALSDLRTRSEAVRSKLAHLEKDPRDLSVSELRELFAEHASSLQQAVVCESHCQSTVCTHLIGLGTLLWLLASFYNTYLYFAYLFVPGVVAFHTAAKEDPSYCGAWVTVLASKVALLVAVLFFFMNLVTVGLWLLQSVLTSSAVSSKISMQARLLDSANLGIPAGQLLVKALLFRSDSDVLTARFAVSLREQSELAQSYADTELRLQRLKQKVSRQAGDVEQMQQEIEALGGGRLVDSVLRLEKGLDLEELRGRGLAMVMEAHERAACAEQAATEEIEKLSERLQEIMKQVTESESFKAAKVKAQEASQEAQQSAQELLGQAQAMSAQLDDLRQ